jgi:MYXO-CTERM domain-containing protein
MRNLESIVKRVALSMASLGLCFGGAMPSQAAIFTLDFAKPVLDTFPPYDSGGGITNDFEIPQAYGDIPGQLDVQYNPAIGIPTGSSLFFWNNNYSNLTDVAYGEPRSTSQVSLIPAAGFQVTLQSFDLGAYLNSDRTTSVLIYNQDLTTLLFSQGPFTVSGITASSFSFTGPEYTRTDGIQIQFGPDAFNVGIDNITFDVSPISAPETHVPGPLPLLGAAAAFGWSRRLRKRIRSVNG